MTAYYNEIDPFAAQWLRNLIAAGHIAPGDVDTRSIIDVRPKDLRGYTQCHFFAGIGVWSLALRRAGWRDDHPVWTGSCPCQPFSTAGAGLGLADERHLWPFWLHLIEQCQPPALLGEQVASKDAEPWLDLVQADLEGLGYAFGAVAFPSAGVGAPHIRDRTYWVAHPDPYGFGARGQGSAALGHGPAAEPDRGACGLGHADGEHAGRHAGAGAGAQGGPALRPVGDAAGAPGAADQLGDAGGAGLPTRQRGAVGGTWRGQERRAAEQPGGAPDATGGPGPTNGYWRDADWLLCRDGKWRPVEPGSFPLADGAPGRVGRLRAYGNAINAQAAQAWIETVMECMP